MGLFKKLFGWIGKTERDFFAAVEAALAPSEEEVFRDSVTEEELKYCGLWGEFLHHEQTDNLDEFWDRFGGMVRSGVKEYRGDA